VTAEFTKPRTKVRGFFAIHPNVLHSSVMMALKIPDHMKFLWEYLLVGKYFSNSIHKVYPQHLEEFALQAPILALNDSVEVFVPLLLQKFRMGPSKKVTGKNSKVADCLF